MTSSCRGRGFVETLLGRKRHLPGISSKNWKERARAERQAVNTVCQGSAADLIKVRNMWCGCCCESTVWYHLLCESFMSCTSERGMLTGVVSLPFLVWCGVAGDDQHSAPT